MVHDRANWRMKARRAALALTAALPFAYLDGAAVHAQSIMRSPNLNIESRIPSINVATPRIDPNIAGRAVTGIGRTTPNLRTYPACSYAYRDSDGECKGQPVTSADGGGSRRRVGQKRQQRPAPQRALTALNLRTIANEIVAEIDGSLSDAQADELARRHGLVRIWNRRIFRL